MRILITETQFRNVIRASEAYDDLQSVMTVADGKRALCFIAIKSVPEKIKKQIYKIIEHFQLKVMYVEGNQWDAYIIYRQGAESEAYELKTIAEKYGGYLSVNATEEDSRRIGQLLSYHPDDIEDYIIHNRKIRSKINEGFVNLPIEDDISLELWEDKNKLELMSIVIPKDLRKQGKGTEIMKMIVNYADEVNKPIYLTPDLNFGATSIERLKRFYKRFGFTKNKNYEVSHSMVREPKDNI